MAKYLQNPSHASHNSKLHLPYTNFLVRFNKSKAIHQTRGREILYNGHPASFHKFFKIPISENVSTNSRTPSQTRAYRTLIAVDVGVGWHRNNPCTNCISFYRRLGGILFGPTTHYSSTSLLVFLGAERIGPKIRLSPLYNLAG